MQHRLFFELSRMFGQEVPLYDKSLLVNTVCNKTVCKLFGHLYDGFTISDEHLEKTSGERHGAIRIGKPSEYRWIARLFATFAMEPHNFYDMTDVGAKSQPIIATAFRSKLNPGHRVFCSLLMTDYFDLTTRKRIETLLETREVFSEKAKDLIIKDEKQGGLDWDDANELISECVNLIFKWTGKAHDYQLYKDLCATGFKIAADIACFKSHHLNHLTPNTLDIDLYTAAMKFCMGEMDVTNFQQRAKITLNRLVEFADRNYLKLHFKILTRTQIDVFEMRQVTAESFWQLVTELSQRLCQPDLQLHKLKHSGFKDHTEGPPVGIPVLLRQDAYKALSEPVTFSNSDGAEFQASHSARFGEIEQRFYATTPLGRSLYDRCLTDAERDSAKRNATSNEERYTQAFAAYPRALPELLEQKLVYCLFYPTQPGRAAKGNITTTDISKLIRLGYVDYQGLRYEDFLPTSAAGIFASNLNQYGTKSTAAEKSVYCQAMLEEILERKIVDANLTYAGLQAESLLNVYSQLGLVDTLTPMEKFELERAMAEVKKIKLDIDFSSTN
ncbi:MAG: DUF1338 family protein [Desulfuromusa sp.]